ncbi:MAG: hypothetical protein PHH72_10080, partial [Parabacteroides sp.]|nr:hypothetical protein [Parabacteroides sp.]
FARTVIFPAFAFRCLTIMVGVSVLVKAPYCPSKETSMGFLHFGHLNESIVDGILFSSIFSPTLQYGHLIEIIT